MGRTPTALKCRQATEKLASQTFRVATFAWYCLLQATHVKYLLAAIYFVYDGCTLALQPNCGEPWTEVIFADDKEGKIQVEWYPATPASDLLCCE